MPFAVSYKSDCRLPAHNRFDSKLLYFGRMQASDSLSSLGLGVGVAGVSSNLKAIHGSVPLTHMGKNCLCVAQKANLVCTSPLALASATG
jgi:hypothetical protein